MRFTAEQRLDDGVLEREFTLGEVPGILWTFGSAPVSLAKGPGFYDIKPAIFRSVLDGAISRSAERCRRQVRAGLCS